MQGMSKKFAKHMELTIMQAGKEDQEQIGY